MRFLAEKFSQEKVNDLFYNAVRTVQYRGGGLHAPYIKITSLTCVSETMKQLKGRNNFMPILCVDYA